ncbi:MAG: hypothetical protein M3P83_04615 [Actinomycetota bacterium]|nr:hypothetical protein [Actinomycetota bacterium]
MAKFLGALGAALSTGMDRVTPARVYLAFTISALIVLHGLAPDAFLVDGVTVGLLGVLVIVVLVPLLSSATLPGGGGLNFREDLDRLQKESEQAAHDQLKATPSEEEGSGSESATSEGGTLLRAEDSIDAMVDEILSEAARSPRVGLMILSAELERAVRRLLLASGWGDGRTVRSLQSGIDRLVELGLLTKSAASALRIFSRVRNEIVHGARAASDDEVLRALDAAIPLLRAVAAIPRERHVVACEPVTVFSDEAATSPIPGVKGLILTTTSPGTALTSRRIYPTTRDGYVVGKDVSWAWGEASWGEAWYRDPETAEVLHAWTGAREFIGHHLD